MAWKYLLLIILSTFSLHLHSIELVRGENVTLEKSYRELLFVRGETILGTVKSSDDIFIGAGEVRLSGEIEENSFFAGGELYLRNFKSRLGAFAGGSIHINSANFKDMILAGGNIEINNVTVQDDLILAGGRIYIAEDVKIQGSSVIAAGKMNISGEARGNLKIVGEHIILSGQYFGDVDIVAEKLEIKTGTVIRGNLSYVAEDVFIAPSAIVQGETSVRKIEERDAMGIVASLWAYITIIGLLMVPSFFVLFFKSSAIRGRKEIRNTFWETFGKGILTLILLPLVFFLMIMSGIAFPLAMGLIPFVVAGFVLAWVIPVFTIGVQLRDWIQRNNKDDLLPTRKRSYFGWTLLGSILASILITIPFIGFILALVILITGIGSIIAVVYKKETKENK